MSWLLIFTAWDPLSILEENPFTFQREFLIPKGQASIGYFINLMGHFIDLAVDEITGDINIDEQRFENLIELFLVSAKDKLISESSTGNVVIREDIRTNFRQLEEPGMIPMLFQFIHLPARPTLGRQVLSKMQFDDNSTPIGTVSQEGSIASKKTKKKRSLKTGKRNAKKKVSKGR